jgi:hypothetical protein
MLYTNVLDGVAEGVAWADAVSQDEKFNDDVAFRILELLGSALTQQKTISTNRDEEDKRNLEKLQENILSGILSAKKKNVPTA